MATLLTLKDLARRWQMAPRSVRRWWQRLGVPPTIPGHSSHRWTPEDAALLERRLAEYWKNNPLTHHAKLDHAPPKSPH